MPASAIEQPLAPVVGDRDHVAEDEDADGLGQRIREVVPAEDPPARPRSDRRRTGTSCARCCSPRCPPRRQVEEREPPDVRRERHEAANTGEDQQGHARPPPCGCPGRPTAPAAPPTAAGTPVRRRPPPRATHRTCGTTSRGFCPTRLMPLPNVPGTSAAAVSSTSGAYADWRRMPTRGGGFPSPVPGHDREVGDHLGVPTFVTRVPQQVVGNGEVEQRLAGH